MGAPLYRVTVSRLTTRGAIVGVLSTGDTGDAIDSGVALVWVPVHSTPLLLTVRALPNASLRDAAVRATPHGRIVTSAVCACGAWYARSRGSQLPSVSHLNCAQTADRLAGTTLRFTIQPGTNRVVTARATLTVPLGMV